MREIKFRGKRVDNGEWVYGDLMQLSHNAKCMSCAIYSTQVDEVDVATVGQFTGLHDKNGREIYEGDVVDFDNYLQGRSCVNFDSGCFRVESSNYTTTLTYHVSLHTHIVGNIHDNPELLK